MITVKPFSIEVVSTHKGFFLLDKLPKNAREVDVWVQTPTGNESVDFVDVFSMNDGSLLAAWVHPTQKLPLHNLQVFCEGFVQVLNLFTMERVLDLYDRPTNAEFGTFIFCPSQVTPSGDWRCDQGIYGPHRFKDETVDRLITDVGQIVFYEPFLSVNSVGHIIYLESNMPELANEKLNNSVVPAVGRTLQECLRLIYEWSVLAKAPFESNDQAAVVASKFVESLGFTQTELDVIENLTPMQVSKFISGSETARVRDMDIPTLSDDVAEILFKRMAASTLSFIVSRNPELFDLVVLLEEERVQMGSGIARFRDYYQIPEDLDIMNHASILEHAFIYFPKQYEYVQTQLRGFANKLELLDSISGQILPD